MRKVKVFNNTNEFLDWTEKFNNCYEYQFIPTIVVDQKKCFVCADLTTTCKSWKTALRRFRKAFEAFDGVVSWYDSLYETLEWEWDEGNFKTTHEFCEKERYGNSGFSYGIEEVSNGIWYIFLSLRGVYSGYENNDYNDCCRYYSTKRPVGPGTFPKIGEYTIVNFDERIYVEAINQCAWGYIDYKDPIEKKLAKQYELVDENEYLLSLSR